jgi:hypothetical protein
MLRPGADPTRVVFSVMLFVHSATRRMTQLAL